MEEKREEVLRHKEGLKSKYHKTLFSRCLSLSTCDKEIIYNFKNVSNSLRVSKSALLRLNQT